MIEKSSMINLYVDVVKGCTGNRYEQSAKHIYIPGNALCTINCP